MPKPTPTHRLMSASTAPQGSGFLGGLVMGAVVGAAGYFLFGTKRGRRLKDHLVETGKKQLQELEPSLKQLPSSADAASKSVKKGFKSAQKTVQRVKKKLIQSAKNTQHQAVEELEHLHHSVSIAKEKADEMQQKLQAAAASIEKKFFRKKGKSLKK